MTRRMFTLLPGLFLLTGCQVDKSKLSWFFGSNEPLYSAEELAALDSGAAAQNSFTGQNNAGPASPQPAPLGAHNGIPVTTASHGRPAGNTSVNQLVQSGRNAIERSGTDDPVASHDPAILQEARGYFEQALALDGSSGAAHHGIAIVADLQRDWPTAEAHYKQALRQKPRDASLLNDVGYSYLLQNRFHESASYLNQAIQVSPGHERAHINLALLGLQRGDRANAEAQLAKIYSPADVQSTLAQLQNSAGQIAANAAGQHVSNPLSGAVVSQTPSAVPQNWPRSTAYQQPQHPQPTQPQIDNRPISVYPPGVLANRPSAVAQNPQVIAPVPTQSAPPVPEPVASAHVISGVPIGNVITLHGQPASVAQPPYAQVVPNNSAAVQPPVAAGLNTGPGNLFPIPPQQAGVQPGVNHGQSLARPPAYGQPIPGPQVSQQVSDTNVYAAAQPMVIQPQPQYVHHQQPQVPPPYAAPAAQSTPQNWTYQQPGVVPNTQGVSVPGQVTVPGPLHQSQYQPPQASAVLGVSGQFAGVAPVQTAALPQAARASVVTPSNQAPPPAAAATPPGGQTASPLTAYEQQLGAALNNQFRQTIQHLDGRVAP